MTDNYLTARAPRYPLDVKVNCDGDKFVYSKNISASGILLISDIDFPEGRILQMNFLLPAGDKEVSAFGKVARIEQVSENYYEIGIRFWDIDDDDKKLIEDFFNNQTE